MVHGKCNNIMTCALMGETKLRIEPSITEKVTPEEGKIRMIYKCMDFTLAL